MTAVRQRDAPAAREQVRGIHHVGITVGDLDRSLAFYRDLLGMRVIGLSVETVGSIVGLSGASARIADLAAGGGRILELIDYGSGVVDAPPRGPDAVGSCHVSFEVGDLRAALVRLASAGHSTMGDVTELSPGGVWQDCTIAYLRDPDGVIVELLERGRPTAAPRDEARRSHDG
jgi:catechol 2,3-dioxygenase-like lactoylglutathione lyase family enzyme